VRVWLQEARRDKAMIDGIVNKLRDEDRRDREDKRRRQAESVKFINDFKQQQAAWKKAQADKEAEEERKIMEYARAKEAREAHVAAVKAEADAEAEAVYARLVAEQKERQRQMDEEESLRMLLAEEESEARLEAQERAVRSHFGGVVVVVVVVVVPVGVVAFGCVFLCGWGVWCVESPVLTCCVFGTCCSAAPRRTQT